MAGRLGAELLVVRVFTATQAELRPDIDAALHGCGSVAYPSSSSTTPAFPSSSCRSGVLI